jgi:hypothetical protein
VFAISITAEPASSVLYTPIPLAPAAALPGGTITTSLPRGSTATALDPGCVVTTPSTATASGTITCLVPGLGPGQALTRHVQWTAPDDALTTELAGTDYSASYAPSGLSALTDDDELTGGSGNFLSGVNTKSTVHYTGPGSPAQGTPMTFTVQPNFLLPGQALFNPSLTLDLPPGTTLNSIKVGSSAYPGCEAPSGGTVTCLIPQGIEGFGSYKTLTVTLTPTASAPSGETLTAHVNADNRGTDTAGSATSPAVP